jgi:hypothetical protein
VPHRSGIGLIVVLPRRICGRPAVEADGKPEKVRPVTKRGTTRVLLLAMKPEGWPVTDETAQFAKNRHSPRPRIERSGLPLSVGCSSAAQSAPWFTTSIFPNGQSLVSVERARRTIA